MKMSWPWMFILLGAASLLSSCESFPDEIEEFHGSVLGSARRLDQAYESAEQLSSGFQTIFTSLDASLERAARGTLEMPEDRRSEVMSGLEGSLKSLQETLDQCRKEILDQQVRALELVLAKPEEFEAAQLRAAAGEKKARSGDPVELAVWLLLQIDRDLDRANRYSGRLREVPAELRIQAEALSELKRGLQMTDALDERARLLNEMSAGELADLKAERALALEEALAAKARYIESSKLTDAVLYDKERASRIEKSD